MNEQTRWASHTYKLVAVLLISFSLYTAAFGVFPDVIQRGMHLALAIILVYLGIITSKRTLLSTLLLMPFGEIICGAISPIVDMV